MSGEKLASALASIGAIAKDKRNTHSGYDYMSEEAVKLAVHKVLAAEGLVPDVECSIVSDEWVPAKNGGQRNLVKVVCSITVDGHSSSGLGAGIDYDDKALMKAQTAAVREAWKNMLVIPSGGDPEASEAADNAQAVEQRVTDNRRIEAAAKEAANPPSGPSEGYAFEGRTLTVPRWKSYGDEAGIPLEQASNATLADVVSAMAKDRSANDPKWGPRNRATGAAAETELARRVEAEASNDGGGWVGGDEPPPPSDDDAPAGELF